METKIESMDECKKLKALKSLKTINMATTPVADEKGGDFKKELLIITNFLKLAMVNEEEVTPEEMDEAKELLATRIREAKEKKEEEEAAAREAAMAQANADGAAAK